MYPHTTGFMIGQLKEIKMTEAEAKMCFEAVELMHKEKIISGDVHALLCMLINQHTEREEK